jgi:hypothetical protein
MKGILEKRLGCGQASEMIFRKGSVVIGYIDPSEHMISVW